METWQALAERLVTVGGVVAVALGGSRARGTHRPDSDVDLGLYYRGTLDVAALQALAIEVGDAPASASQRVDWIYRDLDRVERIADECRRGRYEIGVQPGHPLGFYSHAYAGEVALCRPLADPAGELAAVKAATATYPPELGEALVAGLWEADFTVGLAGYGARGGDPAYAAGCLFRAAGVLCHALHGHAGRWVINEKGLVAATGLLPGAPAGFAERCQALLACVSDTPADIAGTVSRAAALVSEVRAAVA